MKNTLSLISNTCLCAFIGLIANGNPTQAITMIQGAASVSTNMGASSPPPPDTLSYIIDQSGLSLGYTNGSALDAYLALNPRHTFVFSGNEWYSSPGITSGSIDFDLGTVFPTSSVVIWSEEVRGINNFSVVTALLPDFSDGILQGSFTANRNPLNQSYLSQRFDFTNTDARYVRLNVVNTYSVNGTALGEVAFGVETIPFEFSPSFGILSLGGIWLSKKILKRKAKSKNPV